MARPRLWWWLAPLMVSLPAGALLLREPATEVSLPARAPNLTVVHVAYASDASGFAPTLASMVSLAKRLEEPEKCIIHLIVNATDLQLASEVVDCFRRALEPQLRAVPEVQLHVAPRVNHQYGSWIKRLNVCRDQALARLYLPKILPDVDRVLYLDFDTTVKGDVGPLYRQPLSNAFGAVVQRDESAKRMFTLTKHPELIEFFTYPEAHTFNSGVLLVDIPKWRAENVTEVLEQIIEQSHMVEDQFLLNVAFQPGSGRLFDQLNEVWNLSQLGTIINWSPHMLRSAKIMHWSGSSKPWTTKYGKPHPYAKFYRKYWEAQPSCPAAEKYLSVNW